MPKLNQAAKRMRQNEVQRVRNRAARASVKTQVAKLLDAIGDNDVDRATKEYRATTKMLDQKAAKGLFHKNTVARRKSRLAARLHAIAKAKP
ncbi:MAG: 30S ribosomal protein S20 [Phycisphaerales bacterium]|nr:30S ribosomal protein S20 [Phycisphaerales bacterium]